VARFGGDEFGILLEDISGEHDAIETAERIAGVFTRPFVLDSQEHFVTTSIGISLARGAELAVDLIANADAAVHRAKERGRGLIPPGNFIPVAEANGLIEPIGRWVLEHACRQAAQWYHARPDSAPLAMSVNLSGVQIANRSLAEMVATVLRATDLDPAQLTLEITESVMLGVGDGLMQALEALKGIGVKLGARRFRHRLLVARLPDSPSTRCTEGRSLLHGRARHRSPRHGDHRGDRRHVACPVARRRRRGCRDPASGRRAGPDELRLRAGL
jgi:predicted signal transduction protein with EAL and GGDEF domain